MKSFYSGNSGVLVREYKGGLIAIILPISPIEKIYRASLKKENYILLTVAIFIRWKLFSLFHLS